MSFHIGNRVLAPRVVQQAHPRGGLSRRQREQQAAEAAAAARLQPFNPKAARGGFVAERDDVFLPFADWFAMWTSERGQDPAQFNTKAMAESWDLFIEPYDPPTPPKPVQPLPSQPRAPMHHLANAAAAYPVPKVPGHRLTFMRHAYALIDDLAMEAEYNLGLAAANGSPSPNANNSPVLAPVGAASAPAVAPVVPGELHNRAQRILDEKRGVGEPGVASSSAPAFVPQYNDALAYLQGVQQRFGEQSETYKSFLSVLNAFTTGAMTAAATEARVKQLFANHDDLLAGFALFTKKEPAKPAAAAAPAPAVAAAAAPKPAEPRYEDASLHLAAVKRKYGAQSSIAGIFETIIADYDRGLITGAVAEQRARHLLRNDPVLLGQMENGELRRQLQVSQMPLYPDAVSFLTAVQTRLGAGSLRHQSFMSTISLFSNKLMSEAAATASIQEVLRGNPDLLEGFKRFMAKAAPAAAAPVLAPRPAPPAPAAPAAPYIDPRPIGPNGGRIPLHLVAASGAPPIVSADELAGLNVLRWELYREGQRESGEAWSATLHSTTTSAPAPSFLGLGVFRESPKLVHRFVRLQLLYSFCASSMAFAIHRTKGDANELTKPLHYAPRNPGRTQKCTRYASLEEAQAAFVNQLRMPLYNAGVIDGQIVRWQMVAHEPVDPPFAYIPFAQANTPLAVLRTMKKNAVRREVLMRDPVAPVAPAPAAAAMAPAAAVASMPVAPAVAPPVFPAPSIQPALVDSLMDSMQHESSKLADQNRALQATVSSLETEVSELKAQLGDVAQLKTKLKQLTADNEELKLYLQAMDKDRARLQAQAQAAAKAPCANCQNAAKAAMDAPQAAAAVAAAVPAAAPAPVVVVKEAPQELETGSAEPVAAAVAAPVVVAAAEVVAVVEVPSPVAAVSASAIPAVAAAAAPSTTVDAEDAEWIDSEDSDDELGALGAPKSGAGAGAGASSPAAGLDASFVNVSTHSAAMQAFDAGLPLTLATLGPLPDYTRRLILGERLYPLVRALAPDSAGKITGMLLELDVGEVLLYINSPPDLQQRVQDAIKILDEAKTNAAQAQ